MSGTIPERYVLLALRLGRHLDGLVDAYIGPPAQAELVAGEKPTDPRLLEQEAASLRASLPGSGLEEERVRWMGPQLAALETVASRIAGDEISWAEEVERCFGVRPEPTPEEVFEEAHERLATAFPGPGEVGDRYRAWSKSTEVPADLVLPALQALADDLRTCAHELVELPEQEGVVYELVEAKPWMAFNWYLGDLRSRVEINADIPLRRWALPLLAAHEAYPGHHTERASKEQRLLRERGWTEFSVMVVTAPEALIAEGIAMIALDQALEEPHRRVAEVLAGLDIDYDPELMALVYEVETLFDRVMTNAASLLHGEGRSEREVLDYIKRWALSTEDLASHTLRFIDDPSWRAYASAYTDGAELCKRFVEREPNGFQRLLTEPLTTSDLL